MGTLKNTNIRLRALEPGDLDMLYCLENDQSLWQDGCNTMPYSRDALSLYIATCSNDFFQDRQLRMVVDVGGEAVGLVDLFDYDPKHSRAEVGIAICPQYHCRGYGTQALEALIDMVERQLPLHQLYAHVAQSNMPAQRTFLRAGFHQQAIIADWIARPHQGFVDAVLYQYIF